MCVWVGGWVCTERITLRRVVQPHSIHPLGLKAEFKNKIEKPSVKPVQWKHNTKALLASSLVELSVSGRMAIHHLTTVAHQSMHENLTQGSVLIHRATRELYPLWSMEPLAAMGLGS